MWLKTEHSVSMLQSPLNPTFLVSKIAKRLLNLWKESCFYFHRLLPFKFRADKMFILHRFVMCGLLSWFSFFIFFSFFCLEFYLLHLSVPWLLNARGTNVFL